MKYLYFFSFLILLESCATRHSSIPNVPSNLDDYIMMEDNINTHSRYLNGNNLLVMYQENYNDQDGKLEYNIFNQKQIIVQSNSTQTIAVKYGMNKLQIPLNNLSPGLYVLEIINEKGVKKYLTFLKSV